MQNSREEDKLRGESTNLIRLHNMEQAAKAGFPEDDWTGVSNQLIRRKLQNRINQRLYRQRITGPGRTKKAKVGQVLVNDSEATPPETIECCVATLKRELAEATEKWQQASSSNHSVSTRTQAMSLFLTKTTVKSVDSNVYFPMSTDHLLTLIQYNVFRAVMANAFLIGFDFQSLCSNKTSQFACEHTISADILADLPPSLQPSDLQKNIPHPVLIDLFPLPGMRDNLVRAEGAYDRGSLVADIFDTGEKSNCSERNGLIVWGEPWSSDVWEITEGFARKWSWIIEGCSDILKATDVWRRKRGEPPLATVL